MAGKDLASRMREQVDIQVQQSAPNDRGGRTATWVALDTVWAEIIALRGDEALSNGVQRGTQLWRVTMRNRGDVTVKHRLKWGAIVMDIRTAAPTPDRAALVMTCESGLAATA